MKTKYARWFLGELNGLITRGLLTPEAAGSLRAYYSEHAASHGRLTRDLVLGVFGAILIGGGVVLLLAHNWTELARPLRAVLALLPLAISLAAAGYALLRKAGSAAWRESTAIAVTLAIAAAIGLITQTYHLGDVDFLLTWAVLTLPVVYVLQAALPAVFYLAIILFWAGDDGSALGYWLLMAAIAPFLVTFLRRSTPGLGALLGWCTALSLPVAVGVTFGHMEEIWLYAFSLLFAGMALEGSRRSKALTWARSPLALVGVLGVMGVAFLLSFKSAAAELIPKGLDVPFAWVDGSVRADEVTVWVLLAALAARVVRLYAKALTESRLVTALLGGLPLLAALVAVTAWPTVPAAVLFNVFLAALSLAVVAEGLRCGHGGWMNLGLTGFSLLVVGRFFESDLPLAARGLAFVVVGIAFLAVNRALGRRSPANAPDRMTAVSGEAS